MRISFAILLTFAGAAFAQYQPHIIWDRSGVTDSAAYGTQILPLGDQNDDGFADWAVVAWGNIGYGGTQSAYLEFFHGSSIPSTHPIFTYHEDSTTFDALWYGTERVGDLNGDSYQDWMLKLRPRSHPPFFTYKFFYGGTNNSSVPAWEWNVPSNAGLYALRDAFGGNHGDFNGDGFDDIYSYDVDDVLKVYYGGNPMDTLPDWTLHQPPAGFLQSIPYAVGDFNGDGASDFMCFNMNNGNLAVFLGGANPDTVPAYSWSNTLFPYAGIDSLNGDNAAEWGATYVHFGRPVLSPVPDAYLNSRAGAYAADGGDFNGDGFHDLILWTWSTLTNPFGALDLHLGSAWINPDPVFEIEGNTAPFNLRGIYTAIGLGDVNGDQLGDLAIGVWNETFGPRRGRCVILGGDTLRVSANPAHPELPQEIAIEVYPNPFNAETTIKLTLPWSERLNELTIYNALGRTIRHELLPPFVATVTYGFDARDLPSGSYFVHVQSGALSRTEKLILIR